MKKKFSDDLDEELQEEFTARVDTATLRAGLSKRDAAAVYRCLADEFRLRAQTLDREADLDGE